MLGDVRNFDGSGDVLRASRRNTMDENWQRSADTQHYIINQRGADTRGHVGTGNNTGLQRTAIEFPTRFGGKFARAMSSIVNDPAANSTGSGEQNNTLGSNFHQEVQQALAISPH